MSAPQVAVLALLLALPGCAPDARRERAERTLGLARRALARVEASSGGEGEDLPRARADAERWLEHAEQAVEVWPASGSLAWETMAPCLGRSLGTLREALASGERAIPESLRQAEALARTATERRCARRRRHGAARE